jgi:hypothetical protein
VVVDSNLQVLADDHNSTANLGFLVRSSLDETFEFRSFHFSGFVATKFLEFSYWSPVEPYLSQLPAGLVPLNHFPNVCFVPPAAMIIASSSVSRPLFLVPKSRRNPNNHN